jgi:hypothetical protein
LAAIAGSVSLPGNEGLDHFEHCQRAVGPVRDPRQHHELTGAEVRQPNLALK